MCQAYCTFLTTPDLDGRAQAGSTIVTKKALNHHYWNYLKLNLQITMVKVEYRAGGITLSESYCNPRHKISEATFTNYLKILGNCFIAGGVWNMKHSYWGSQTTVTHGC